MNYRVLFIISFLILAVAFIGLFVMPNSENGSSSFITGTQQPLPEKPKKEEVLITTATVKQNVKAGNLLQIDDYQLSELSVEIDNPLTEYNLKPLIDASGDHSLQGFLTTQYLQKGSLLSPSVLVAPTDPKFLVASINPAQEVAYRLYVHQSEAYILDTLQNGAYASIFSYQDVGNDLKANLVRVLDKSLVLFVRKYSEEELSNASNKDILGYITFKLKTDQIKPLYSLPRDNRLIALPTDKSTPTNNRGALIRKLRG